MSGRILGNKFDKNYFREKYRMCIKLGSIVGDLLPRLQKLVEAYQQDLREIYDKCLVGFLNGTGGELNRFGLDFGLMPTESSALTVNPVDDGRNTIKILAGILKKICINNETSSFLSLTICIGRVQAKLREDTIRILLGNFVSLINQCLSKIIDISVAKVFNCDIFDDIISHNVKGLLSTGSSLLEQYQKYLNNALQLVTTFGEAVNKIDCPSNKQP